MQTNQATICINWISVLLNPNLDCAQKHLFAKSSYCWVSVRICSNLKKIQIQIYPIWIIRRHLFLDFIAKLCTICCQNDFQVGTSPRNLKMSWAIILRLHFAPEHCSATMQLQRNTFCRPREIHFTESEKSVKNLGNA